MVRLRSQVLDVPVEVGRAGQHRSRRAQRRQLSGGRRDADYLIPTIEGAQGEDPWRCHVGEVVIEPGR